MASKKWEGISLLKRVANVNIRSKKIKELDTFKHCLSSVKEQPHICLKKNKCIIGLLIQALIKRGAKL